MDRSSLYGLPLEEFVPARDALAKELRARGDKEEAAAVKKLRKPPVPVWAANQVARRSPDVVRALVDAGNALRAAQQRVVAGRPGAGDELRAATRRHRDALGAALGAAADFVSGATADRLRDVLQAASTDESLAPLLLEGVLAGEPEPAGFGALPGPDPLLAEAAPEGGPDGGDEAGAAARARRAEQRRRLEETVREARAAATAAAREADVLAADADTAMRLAHAARRRADEARRRADEARQRAERAKARLEEAEAALADLAE